LQFSSAALLHRDIFPLVSLSSHLLFLVQNRG
jgi:hypothetical protein